MMMTGKYPKDMTASELLRWAANGEPNEYGNTTVTHKLFSALSDKPYRDTTYNEDARNILALADKIDAELAAAKKEAAYTTDKPLAEVVAHYTGLHAKDGESISEWLDRWFLPRPRFEDGEPVQFGDEVYGREGIWLGFDAANELLGLPDRYMVVFWEAGRGFYAEISYCPMCGRDLRGGER